MTRAQRQDAADDYIPDEPDETDPDGETDTVVTDVAPPEFRTPCLGGYLVVRRKGAVL